jgi:D-arabinose 1-dehydrogenase-like Zn-dependent alcohol dehydrogenase
MKAIRIHAFGPPERLMSEEVPDTTGPKWDEVILAVGAAGVCYRDLLDRLGRYPRLRLPFTPGHELAGRVSQVGEGVQKFQPGDRVASIQYLSCGACSYCRSERASICKQKSSLGQEVDGAYAERVRVTASGLCFLPDEISFEAGAILACTLGTSLRALKKRAELKVGEKVLITAAGGGVGMHAVQVAKLMGGYVIAITRSKEKVQKLKSIGADEVIEWSEDGFSSRVKALTNGEGVDVALEIAGSTSFEQSVRSMSPGGRIVIVGEVGGGLLQVNPGLLIVKEISVLATTSTTQSDLALAIDLVKQGKVKPIISQVFPLEKAAQAHRFIETGQQVGRVVLTIGP